MSKFVCTRWAFDLSLWRPTLPQLIVAVSGIQEEERERLMKFYFIDDFLASLVGRLLIRKYIERNTDLKYGDIRLSRDVHGKPFLSNGLEKKYPLSFNISHQGDCVILAGAVNTNYDQDGNLDFGIGADVSKIEYSGGRPLSEFFRLMNSKFSENEWSFIKHPHHNAQDSLKAFMRNWSLKEAFVKELGVGITIDLRQISFTLKTKDDLDLDEESSPLTTTKLVHLGYPVNNCHFEEHLLKRQYCAAIACRNFKPEPSKFQFLDIADILSFNSNNKDDPVIVQYCRNALNKPRKLNS